MLLDFETGGLPSEKNPVHNVPICEVACLGVNGITLEEVLRYDNVVKPYDPKHIYEEGAMKVHGLTREVCERDGERLKQVVEDICLVAQETNVYQSKICRPMIVGHNVTFDIPFLEDAASRALIDLSHYFSGYRNQKGQFVLHYIDTMHMSKQADGHKDDKIKYNLGDCCSRHGGELADGHRALNDVIATSSLFRSFVARLRSTGSSIVSDGSGQVRKHFQI